MGDGQVFVNVVADHGARGDGSTDDTTAIENADADAASNGGTVFFPPGTYVAQGLTPSTGVRWLGVGGTKLKLKAGATGSLISVDGATTDVVIDGLELDGNSANVSSTNNVVVIDGSRQRITNCYVHDAENDGIVVQTGASHVEVANNRVFTCGRFGITCQGTSGDPVTNVSIHDNHVKDSGESGEGAGLGIVGVGKYVSFVGNITESTGGDGCAAYNRDNAHILVSGNVFNDPANHGTHVGGNYVSVVGNTIYSPSDYGIYVASDPNEAPTASVGFVVSGNLVQAPGNFSGIHVDNYDGGSITGNTVLTPDEHGINVKNCDGVAISGNHCEGSVSGSGIRLEGSARVSVAGNVSVDNAVRGLGMSGTVTDVNITGNTFAGNTGHGILAATGAARLNIAQNILRSNTAGNFSLATADNRVGPNFVDDSTSVTSADSITVPLGLEYAVITGTTTITTISRANRAGSRLTLRVSEVCQLTDNGTTLNLRGNFTGIGVLTLVSDGSNWYEQSRSTEPSSAYTPTNVTTDRAYDADTVLVAELADVVGTLIADLQAKGLLG